MFCFRFCLVQLDKYIYAVGGCNLDGNLSSVSRYSEDNDEWDLVAAMPKALRSEAFFLVVSENIFCTIFHLCEWLLSG
jgi:Kelch motif